MLAKFHQQVQRFLQSLGVVPPAPQPVRISEAEQQRLREEALRRR